MNETQMTLAVDLSGESRIDGWLASEKLNGCRAYWTGKEFFTRGGNVIHAPAWFTKGLPDLHLDGEINAGRDGTHGKPMLYWRWRIGSSGRKATHEQR